MRCTSRPLLMLAAPCAMAMLAACSRPEPAPEPIRAVRTLTVAGASSASTIEYAAEIKARVESRLGFRVGGKLIERSANAGDTVRKGQVLARLDAQDLRLGQDAAKAAMAAADVNADLAAADFERYKGLFNQGFISAAELQRREAAMKAARAQAAQARAQAGVQGNQAAYSALLADADGVITAVEAEPGAVVAAGTPIVRLAWNGPRDAVFAVPEGQVSMLRQLVGKPEALQLRLWANPTAAAQPGATMRATVREVAGAADPQSRTFAVKADIGHAAAALGQTATVTLQTTVAGGVVKVPLTAVMHHPGGSAVWVVEPASMTVRAQPVVVSGAEAESVVISSGLVPGQRVVTAGVHALTAGQKVRFYGEAAAPAASAASR